MTWRQTEPELFFTSSTMVKVGGTPEPSYYPKPIQAILTLEHLGSDSQPDGQKAHIAVKDNCYVLYTQRLPEHKNDDSITYGADAFWFWEAVQALQRLPNPSLADDWLRRGFI